MRQLVVCVILSVLPAAAVVGGEADGPDPKVGKAPANAVLFAPVRPVFLRLRVEVDGQSLGRFRERAVAQWFRQLDGNHNGFLEKSELAEFEKGLSDDPTVGPPLKWDRVDTRPADGKLSLAEFRAYVERRLGPPLVVAVRSETSSEVDASLFEHLDQNGDGVLTEDELRNARAALALLDADDDETISVAELLAGTAGAKAAAKTSPRRLPLYLLGSETAETIAAALNREYGTPMAALKQRIGSEPAELEMSFQLFDQRHGGPRVTASAIDRLPGFAWRPASSESGTLVVNGLKVVLSAKRTRGSTGDMSSFYALRFAIVDQDKNNYLDRQEFKALGLPEAEFSDVDANGDGQITQPELLAFLRKSGNAYVNQVVIAVSDESQSLFEFLDTRADGRLSPRELIAAPGRLKALDRNSDGKLSLGELRTQIHLEAEVKRPAAARPGLRIAAPRNQSSTPVSPDQGPEWFRRMDRNFDGDVSWREFLGPRAVFDRLDTDHDGLLSPEEAARAR